MATPLNIKDPEAYQLASEIARSTGKSLTRVVVDALKREKEALHTPAVINMGKVYEILARMQTEPGDGDSRPAEEITRNLDYETGLPR